ncbi:arylamine N-acetyltransferase family protein [Streptomyces sp. enrichment culture]|uniref:arylamine N-acetyltransferase family protein n=1 Tax=Streptomyces sp. enrichment culture TaxID=1795815 RepID=UPI003F551912
MNDQEFEGYLDRLGVTPTGTPSRDELFALQRAHLERVPYENIGIHVGRPPGMEAELSVRRFAAGQGGYCFHLNGGFAALLAALGYDVTLHVGGVHEDRGGRGANGNHMALTVRVDGEGWFVDVGLGDGPVEPLPLRAGTYRQGPFTYGMEPSVAEPGGWTFLHDERGTFRVMEFRGGAAAPEDFAAEHVRLSTAPDSPFVTTFAVLRRDRDAAHVLRGRVVRRVGAAGTEERVVDSEEEWFGLLEGAFHRDLGDLDADDRAVLWKRVSLAHEEWLRARDERAARG